MRTTMCSTLSRFAIVSSAVTATVIIGVGVGGVESTAAPRSRFGGRKRPRSLRKSRIIVPMEPSMVSSRLGGGMIAPPPSIVPQLRIEAAGQPRELRACEQLPFAAFHPIGIVEPLPPALALALQAERIRDRRPAHRCTKTVVVDQA